MQPRRMRFIKYWLPVIIYAIFIFSLSAIPGSDIPKIFSYQDVIFHFIEYAIFAWLINRALLAENLGLGRFKRFVWVFLISFIYASSDEFHQAFVPGRCPSILDVFIDCLGAAIGSILYQWPK